MAGFHAGSERGARVSRAQIARGLSGTDRGPGGAGAGRFPGGCTMSETTLNDRDVVVLGGARTPFGTFMGSLRDVTATDLGAIAAREALARAGVNPKEVDEVVFGNVMQTSRDAIYLARHVALKAGVPIETPALTVNRLCGSGLQAVVSAAQLLMLGEGTVALAGGAENMTQAPFVIRGARSGLSLGEHQLDDSLWEALVDSYCGCGMAITAENL